MHHRIVTGMTESGVIQAPITHRHDMQGPHIRTKPPLKLFLINKGPVFALAGNQKKRHGFATKR
jgi:hypothetical protein